MTTHRNRRVTPTLTKSEAAALIDLLNGDTTVLPRINETGNRPALLGAAKRKLVTALERAVRLDAEARCST